MIEPFNIRIEQNIIMFKFIQKSQVLECIQQTTIERERKKILIKNWLMNNIQKKTTKLPWLYCLIWAIWRNYAIIVNVLWIKK